MIGYALGAVAFVAIWHHEIGSLLMRLGIRVAGNGQPWTVECSSTPRTDTIIDKGPLHLRVGAQIIRVGLWLTSGRWAPVRTGRSRPSN